MGAGALFGSSTGMDIHGPDGVTDWPSSFRTKLSTNSEASNPQAGQRNLTGLVLICGVSSNSYFVPHEHWIFMG